MPIRGLREFFLQREKQTEFDVQTGDFGGLEIRQGDQANFFYFYESGSTEAPGEDYGRSPGERLKNQSSCAPIQSTGH
jgi:hypothetical protein